MKLKRNLIEGLVTIAVLVLVFGGLTLLIGTIMTSYLIWPLGMGGIQFNMQAVRVFENEFGRFFSTAFIFAAPVLTILYVIDMGLGLLNRFAQQFNVFSLAMPIKAAASIFVIIVILPFIAQQMMHDMMSRPDLSSAMLEQVGKADRPLLASPHSQDLPEAQTVRETP